MSRRTRKQKDWYKKNVYRTQLIIYRNKLERFSVTVSSTLFGSKIRRLPVR
jgi:hypothetical protein